MGDTRPDVLVVGAGVGGIAVSRELSAFGIDHEILESADGVGGTWRQNTYPGCACDIPSHLYSFSWAQNPSWTRHFAPQPEIAAYLEGVARSSGAHARTRFGVRLDRADFDGAAGRWQVRTRDGGELRPRVLLMCTGALQEPRLPSVPGLGEFGGPVVHTARWDASLDLRGRRVALVGTGASAVQVLPHLAAEAAAVAVFQRTPAWVLPRSDAPVPAWLRTAYRRAPALQRTVRAAQFWRREAAMWALAHDAPLIDLAERAGRRHLAASVPDPALRERLTPRYRLGCKRVLFSDDYYPAVSSPHVALLGALAEVRGDDLVDADGNAFAADVVVLATGFEVLPPPMALRVANDGVPVAADWGRRAGAHLGIATAGVPNLFWSTGPNSGLGANSMVVVIEAQARAMARGTAAMLAADTPLAVSPAVQAQYTDRVAQRSARGVWTRGSCESWYLDRHGRLVALWPDQTWRLVREAGRFDPARDLVPVAAAPPAPADPGVAVSRHGS